MYAVNFPYPTIRHHAIELVPFLGVQTADALVGIYVDQLPVRVFPNVTGVVVHLGQIGVELVGGVAADTGIIDSEFLLENRQRRASSLALSVEKKEGKSSFMTFSLSYLAAVAGALKDTMCTIRAAHLKILFSS